MLSLLSINRVKKCWLIIGLYAGMVSCNQDKPELTYLFDDTPYIVDYENGTLPEPYWPADNPLTVKKVSLGRMLFYDKQLSLDGSVSCASCHNQSYAFSDTARFSKGVGGSLGLRQAMAIFNMAWNENAFFWDGRAELLRDQALMPIEDHLEMKESLPNVIAKLESNINYRNQFRAAFGSEDITAERIALALENFMMSIVSDGSKYDRYLAGKDTLSASEERGRQLFFAEYNPFFPSISGADCAHCHSGKNFENDQYMNNGLDATGQITDFGRHNVTGNASDIAKFKVTSLRNIAVTPPYMHDGRFKTLEEVVDHYNTGIQTSATLDPALDATTSTGLMLDSLEKVDLINFLHTLTDHSLLNNPDYSSPF